MPYIGYPPRTVNPNLIVANSQALLYYTFIIYYYYASLLSWSSYDPPDPDDLAPPYSDVQLTRLHIFTIMTSDDQNRDRQLRRSRLL